METSTAELCEALEALDRPRIEALFQRALLIGSPLQVIERLIVPALEQVGDGWHDGRIALSQVYMSSRICEDMIKRVLPPRAPGGDGRARIAIVVLNDYHMLGKRIVHSVLRAGGFDLFDYERMDVAELVDRVEADRLDILLVSVLMLPSALKVPELRSALEGRGVRVRIAVGGAPFLFDSNLWREVGADAMGHSAGDAIKIVQRWMEEAK